jgi:hypothetical protein
MPSTSILEGTMSVLDSLNALEAEYDLSPGDMGQITGEQIARNGRKRHFQSRKSIVMQYVASAAGLKSRVHGAVSLVSLALVSFQDLPADD